MFKTEVKPQGAAEWFHCKAFNIFDAISLINKMKDNGNLQSICFFTIKNFRVFIRHRRSANSPSTTQNSLAKFHSFPEVKVNVECNLDV